MYATAGEASLASNSEGRWRHSCSQPELKIVWAVHFTFYRSFSFVPSLQSHSMSPLPFASWRPETNAVTFEKEKVLEKRV